MKASNVSKILIPVTLLAFQLTVQAELKHRYSFNGDIVSTLATDSVSGANGTLADGAVLTGSGAVTLDGGAAHVDLPNGIVSALTDVTIEAWVNWNGGVNWSRLFDFGTSDAGEGLQGAGQAFFFLSPQSGLGGTPMLLGKSGDADLTAPALPSGQLVQVAVVFSPSSNYSALFVNGERVATGSAATPLSAVNDVNNWLGRSQFSADPHFAGSITEFRIYDTGRSRIEIALSAAAGPDLLGGSDPGALQSVALTVQNAMFLGNTQQASATADFANLPDFDLTDDPEAVYSSGDTNILVVSASGVVQAVGTGTASVIVEYRGMQDSEAVTVSLPPSVSPEIQHRYSFGEAAGVMIANDSVGDADGTLQGGAAFGGDGFLYFDGVSAYVDLPNGLISSFSAVTFEAWISWGSGDLWQRVFDFGTSDLGEGQQGAGQNFIYFTPAGGPDLGTARIGVAGQEDTVGSVFVPAGVQSHVVVVYNPVNNFSRIYIDGVQIGTGTASVPLSSIVDVNNWLGRSQFSVDPYFLGNFNEFRIYSGVLSPESITFNSAAGPDVVVTDPGALESLSLQVPSQVLSLGAAPMNATVFATYANVANVNVTTFSGLTYETSNSNIVSVAENGEIDATGTGTATVTARFQGAESSLTIEVTLPPGYTPPTLIHRYSFSEAPGSLTVEDSVGEADGTVMGGGTFSGTGTLVLNGTNGFVDLPNGLVSGLENVTFEAWVTWTSQRYWERVFDFGTSSNGEGQQGTGQAFVFLTARGGPNPGTLLFGVAGQADLIAPLLLPNNRLVHVAVSYNAAAGSTRVYVDGERVVTGPASVALSNIQDLNVWLGRSNFLLDPHFTGSFDEFRIYNGALLEADVKASFAAGPNPGAVRPSLSVQASGGNLTISWPTNGSAGFVLRSSPELGTGQSWSNVGAPVNESNGNYVVTVPLLAGPQFFRLEQ